MKRLLFVILAIFTAIISVGGVKKASAEQLDIKSKSAILMDANTKTIVYSHAENERRPIASMTKIMLLNLCFESVKKGELSLDEEIRVSKNASGMGGSQVFLEENGSYKARDLIKSVIIASANDASVALFDKFRHSSSPICVLSIHNRVYFIFTKHNILCCKRR